MNLENEIKPKRMRITLEANAVVQDGSVTMHPGGMKLLSTELIDNNAEDQQKE